MVIFNTCEPTGMDLSAFLQFIIFYDKCQKTFSTRNMLYKSIFILSLSKNVNHDEIC